MPKPEEILTAQISARHTFTNAELLALADKLTSAMEEQDRVEAELASVKADFKSRLERIDLERQSFATKLRSKFEMRETLAAVTMNFPTPGRKSFHRVTEWMEVAGVRVPIIGEFIRDEPMAHGDYQRDLPLEEPEVHKPGHFTEEVREAKCAGGSGDDAPEGYRAVVDGKIGDDFIVTNGNAAWGPVSEESVGMEVRAYTGYRFARPHFTEIGDQKREDDQTIATVREAADSIGTPVGDVLNGAAVAGEAPPVVYVDLPSGYSATRYVGLFRKAAVKAGWSEAQVSLIVGEAERAAEACATPQKGADRALAILKAHSQPKPLRTVAEVAEAQSPDMAGGVPGVPQILTPSSTGEEFPE